MTTTCIRLLIGRRAGEVEQVPTSVADRLVAAGDAERVTSTPAVQARTPEVETRDPAPARRRRGA